MGDEDLTQVLEEIRSFHTQSNFLRNKKLLEAEIKRIEAEIVAKTQSATSPIVKTGAPLKRCIDIHEHAFDESDKFVKIHIPFASTKISEENVTIDFKESSFTLKIDGGDKDYRFTVNSLLKPINIDKSYKKVKDDIISIYLKKSKEGQTWQFLTTTEKRLKDQKSKALADDKDNASSDPMGGLMNIMKKMYDSGDSEMKRSIAKAWTEGQEKKQMDN